MHAAGNECLRCALQLDIIDHINAHSSIKINAFRRSKCISLRHPNEVVCANSFLTDTFRNLPVNEVYFLVVFEKFIMVFARSI